MPVRLAHHGATAQRAEPVTGSSATPKRGAKTRIATSACGGSIIAAHLYEGDTDGADRHARIFADIFGDRFFIELQPHALKREIGRAHV